MKTKTTGPRSASASVGGGWLKPAIGVGAVAGVLLAGYLASGKLLTAKPAGTANATAIVAQMPWVAAASGRVEPRSGEIKVGTGLLGRVAEVLVRVDDKVEAGELLLLLDDEEPRARLAAADPRDDEADRGRAERRALGDDVALHQEALELAVAPAVPERRCVNFGKRRSVARRGVRQRGLAAREQASKKTRQPADHRRGSLAASCGCASGWRR